MRKVSALLISATILLGFGLFVSSCDDDEPPVKPKLSFGTIKLTAIESDANILVEVVLDKPASEDITIEYSLGGTAIDEVAAGTTLNPDYEIVSDYLELEIEEGETTGTIEIDLYSDGLFEGDETIEISIEDVDSDEIEITRDDEATITVKQEDGLVILLEWPAPTSDKNADMDIIVRAGANTTTWSGVLTVAADGSFTGPEFVFIPKVVEFAAYGVSYVYYDGSLDPLAFTVTFIDVVNGVLEAEASTQSFDVSYTAVNKNKWTDIATTQVVQTFLKTAGVFGTISSITVPVTGSRTGTTDNFQIPLTRNSGSVKWAREFQNLIRK